MIEFLGGFAAAAQQTEKLCDRLREWSLLRSVDIKLKVSGEESHVAQGLFVVDERALGRLSDEQFQALRHDGHLVAIYAHLLSLQALKNISRRQDRDSLAPGKKENMPY
jgi:SapC